MKALVYTGPHQLEIRDVEKPRAAAGEALVRVHCCGICGSDMHAWAGHDERRPAPLTLGHEVSGIVEGGRLDGKRVTVNPLATCGECEACTRGRNNLCSKRQIISMPPRQGGFADYITIPVENLVEVPPGVSFEKAALAEPLACGWHAARMGEKALDRPLRETRALVIGGGAIGTGAALALRAMGAGSIILLEPNDARREKVASLCGFDTIASAQQMQAVYDLIIDGVGFAATRETASKLTKPGGVIVHIGLGDAKGGLDIRRATLQEITFIGTYTYTPQDFRETAAAIFNGSLGKLDWMEFRALEEGAAAFAAIASGSVAAPKIILQTGAN